MSDDHLSDLALLFTESSVAHFPWCVPNDIWRLLFNRYLGPVDRVVSCWRVCRLWQYILTEPLPPLKHLLYCRHSRRSEDLQYIEASELGVPANVKNLDCLTKPPRQLEGFDPWYAHVIRVMAFHDRKFAGKLYSSYMDAADVRMATATDSLRKAQRAYDSVRSMEVRISETTQAHTEAKARQIGTLQSQVEALSQENTALKLQVKR